MSYTPPKNLHLSGDTTGTTPAAGDNDTSFVTSAAMQTALGSPSSVRPSTRVSRSTGQSIPTAAWTAMSWVTVDYDLDGMFSASAPTRLTVVTPGSYTISGSTNFAATTGAQRYCRIKKNGTTVIGYGSSAPGSTAEHAYVAATVHDTAVAGDYYEFEVEQATAGALATAGAGAEQRFAAVWSGGTGAAWGNAGSNAYHSTTQSIAHGTATLVAFDSESFDTDALHSTSANTGRLTATTAGTYLVMGTAYFAANAVGTRVATIKKNAAGVYASGTLIAEESLACAPTAGYGTAVPVVGVVQLAAGDYVELFVQQSSGAALNIVGGVGFTTFSALRVGYQTNPNKMGSRVSGGFQEATTDYTTSGGTSLTITVTHDGVTPIRLTAYGYCTNTIASQLCGFKIMDGATVIQDSSSLRTNAANENIPVQISRVVAAQAAGTVKTYTVVNASPVSGVATIYGSVGGRYIEATWAG